MSKSTELIVDLGKRSYPIHIGKDLLAQCGKLIAERAPSNRLIIITDEQVAAAGDHLKRLQTSLQQHAVQTEVMTLPAGESTKSFPHLEKLLNDLLALKPDRKTTLIALGGGVVGDITGFAASILLRGVPFIQIPTTLLAMVDSSVGGKTGIDTAFGKNLIGSFYQPRAVIADVTTLDTLPERQSRAGYAEVVKYGLIDMPEFFERLEAKQAGREELVETSCRAKARIVAEDEKEEGKRALLNLGHTFGHALELQTGYGDSLLHGEAVAIGMVMAFQFSERLGLCPAEDTKRVIVHLQENGLPVSPLDIQPEWSVDALITAMQQDKKATDGQLNFILVRGIGRAYIAKDVDAGAVHSFLHEILCY